MQPIEPQTLLENFQQESKYWAEHFAPCVEDDNNYYRGDGRIDGKDAAALGELFTELMGWLERIGPILLATKNATDPTMQQIVRMIQEGWTIEFYPRHLSESSGILANKPGETGIWVDDWWQDDIPAAWARLVEKWERQVGDA